MTVAVVLVAVESIPNEGDLGSWLMPETGKEEPGSPRAEPAPGGGSMQRARRTERQAADRGQTAPSQTRRWPSQHSRPGHQGLATQRPRAKGVGREAGSPAEARSARSPPRAGEAPGQTARSGGCALGREVGTATVPESQRKKLRFLCGLVHLDGQCRPRTRTPTGQGPRSTLSRVPSHRAQRVEGEGGEDTEPSCSPPEPLTARGLRHSGPSSGRQLTPATGRAEPRSQPHLSSPPSISEEAPPATAQSSPTSPSSWRPDAPSTTRSRSPAVRTSQRSQPVASHLAGAAGPQAARSNAFPEPTRA